MVMEKFQSQKGLPHCIGVVDGTHIPIKAPYDNPEQYVNTKKFHSLQLQRVCDPDRFFTDVYCAYPGSVHDAHVLRNSPLYQDAEQSESEMFPGSSYIIGDAAYPLKTWLITGFKNDGKLTREQREFNYHLRSTHMKIEHTFGLLKG
ncbi:protein ALP1-like [Dendronephthya gigantea]|uniref:protein ALP1-like n=1 Tax=Dendronephthya gigantea TaxID=151771 RepID=UPI00106DA07D|nr:protein ALP1-like [Dendronephthya gigantea]